MGLAERRGIKDFQDSRLPALQQQINQAAGFDVKIDVKWETLAEPDQTHLYNDSWAKVYFEPLIAAFKSISRDDMGKQALKDSLKTIVIENAHDIYYGDRWASFDAGVLHLDHKPTTNVDNVKERTDGVVKVLEDKL